MSLFLPSAEPAAGGGREPASEPAANARMWQLHDRYILAQTRAGLIVVDQHAAHERVLYEEALRGFERGSSGSQRLLFPFTLRLPAGEARVAAELGALLARIGYELEPADDGAVVVSGAPNPHPRFDAERCLREMLEELAHGSELVDAARSQHQRIALSFASRAAVQGGQRLSAAEMGELIDRLFATETPYEDLHGRPTVVQLSLEELRSWFGR